MWPPSRKKKIARRGIKASQAIARYPRHQFGEASLACERLHETLPLEFRQQMCSDTASEVNAAGRQHLERKIAGLIAKNRNKNLERGGAQSAGAGATVPAQQACGAVA